MPPAVSVVIASLTGQVDATVASLQRQSFTDWDLAVVTGVRPAARARNEGLARTRGALVLYLDDDAELGDAGALATMVAAMADPGVALVGSSKILPPGSSWFQRRVAAEVPRWVYPVLDAPAESNPPLDSYGFTAATTTCCLLRRSACEEVGGFDDRLPTGEDTEFFVRLRRAGHRFVVPARCWAFHAPPATLRGLLAKSFRYGVGHACEARLDPARAMALLPLDRAWARAALVLAPVALVPSMLVSVDSLRPLRVRPALRPLQALSRFATLYGYAWGFLGGAGPVARAGTG